MLLKDLSHDRPWFGLILLALAFLMFASMLDDGSAVETAAQAAQPTNAEAEQIFADIIIPFLDDYCLNCHDDSIQRGDVDLSTLTPQTMAADAPLWRKVHEQIAHRTMPPPDRKQPSEDDRLVTTDWIDQQLTATFARLPKRGGPALTRRLTGKEFDRSIRDLTGIDRHFSAQFPADGGGGEGFTNNASTLFMSSLLISKVLDTSSLIADEAHISWGKGIQFGQHNNQPPQNSAADAFTDVYTQMLDARGVFEDDTDRLEQYLILIWQYDQAKRIDRNLTLADFANEQHADPVFLDRLQQMVRVSRAPRGAGKNLVEFFRTWTKTRRIRSNRTNKDESLAEIREIASACVELVRQKPDEFTAYFADSPTKRQLIKDGDEQALEKLVFFSTASELLENPTNSDASQLEGLWIAARLEANDQTAQRDAEKFVGHLMTDFTARAWRRPISDTERVDFSRQYRTLTTQEEKDFEEAIRVMLRGVLVSPNFLFRVELAPKPGKQVAVEPYEMASRLSYFLWGSMPDQELLNLAANNKLQDEQVLRQQVQRMLQDDRAEALAESFFGEWIGYVDLLTQDGPDQHLFPQWKPELAEAMVEQAQQSMAYMIREDRPYTDLIEADYLFVNETLATFLGIPGVRGEQWELVSGADQSRFGVTGLPAVHVMTSHANRTSPVKRGDWLLSTLLGTPTPPPPPNVGELEESEAAASAASLREQLEAHRDNAACASCHNRIDPLGFPLERFDALGRMRKGQIDLEGQLPNGTVFSGPDGLRDVLVSRKELLRRQLVVKALGYALGRGINLEDEPVVQHIEETLEKDPKLSILFTEVVLSPAFRTKTGITP